MIQPTKIHLGKLPDLTEYHIPPRPITVSKKGIVLLPLFKNPDVIAHHAAVCACWAHRSWLRYSDAIDYGIEVKFYVDERVRDTAMPILQRNFIHDNDVIFHNNAEQFDVAYPTTAIQKAASYTDDRFADYDWIVDVDTDIFVMSPNREKLPFFRYFFEICDTDKIGVSWVSIEELTPSDLHWAGGLTKAELNDWKSRFLKLAGENIVDIYFDPQEAITTLNGGIIAVPAKHLQYSRWSDLEFIIKAARDLRDLEAGLSVWDALHSEDRRGNSFFEIFPGIHSINLYDDKDIGMVNRFLDLCEENKPFLVHYATSFITQAWYQGIGVLD